MAACVFTIRGRLKPCMTTPPRLSQATHLHRTYSSFLLKYTSSSPRLVSKLSTSAPASSSFNHSPNRRRHLNMDHADLKHFLADSPPSTVNLEIKQHFDALKDNEKLYAHYISKWVQKATLLTPSCPYIKQSFIRGNTYCTSPSITRIRKHLRLHPRTLQSFQRRLESRSTKSGNRWSRPPVLSRVCCSLLRKHW